MTFNPRPKQGKKPKKEPKPLKRTAIKVNPDAKPLKRTPIKVNPNAKPLKRTPIKINPNAKPIARGEFKPKVRKKARKAAESTHLDNVAALGCIACYNMGHRGTPAEIHHIREGYGAGQRAPDSEAIPLCFNHHSAQGMDGFHGSPSSWQADHGSERKLLSQVRDMLGLEDMPTALELVIIKRNNNETGYRI